jgi:hypothetical protein
MRGVLRRRHLAVRDARRDLHQVRDSSPWLCRVFPQAQKNPLGRSKKVEWISRSRYSKAL